MRTLAIAVLLLMLPVLALAEYNDEGAIIGEGPGEIWDSPGDPCGTCPAPGTDSGITFKNGDMYVSVGSDILQLVNCQVVGSTSVPGAGSFFEIGYDSMRDMWILCNASTSSIYQVNMAGAVVNTWASPTLRPVGATYDPVQDLYWVCDWQINQLNSIDPNTGMPGPAVNVPAGTRIAGLGYHPALDAFFYHGRDQRMSYVISRAGGLLFSFPVPDAGNNNGRGAAVAPDGNGWLTHYEQPTIYCVEIGGATPVEPVTWGSIKAIYN